MTQPRSKWSTKRLGNTAHVFGSTPYSLSLCGQVLGQPNRRRIPESELVIHRLCERCKGVKG